MRLQESTDALAGFGKIYKVKSDASGIVPQISAVFGNCGGGVAVLAAMSDFTFMEEKNAKLFVNSPNTLEGNYADKLDTASVLSSRRLLQQLILLSRERKKFLTV